MAFDVFISYAHHDNGTHGDWVHRFAKRLADDYRSRCGRPLQVFLDKENLNTGDALSDRLQNALNESSLFIPILSPTYLSSKWCRREFLHFLTQTGEVILNGRSRIVPLRLMPYDRFGPDLESRPEVEQITRFIWENEILFADFYEDLLPIDPENPVFSKKIAGLSQNVYDMLQEMAPKPLPMNPAKAETIFLAYTSNSAQKLRSGVNKELQQQFQNKKIARRPSPEASFDELSDKSADALEQFSRTSLASAVCAVFFFDDLEGPKAADTREPVSHLQYRLARERAAADPAFRVFFARQTTDDCAYLQEQLLAQVHTDSRTLPNLEELPAFEVKPIKDFLLEFLQLQHKQQEEEQATQRAEARQPRRVFFIHDHRDKEDPLRNQIDDLIYNTNYDVYVPVFREDAPYVDPDASFRDFWMVCNKAVVLLRHATTAWCNAIKVDLIKAATEKKEPYRMAICVADPEVEKRIREVRSHEFEIINCALSDLEEKLIAFLLKNDHHA